MKPLWLITSLLTALLAGCDNMKNQPAPRASALSLPAPAFSVARGQPGDGDVATTGFLDGAPVARSPVPFTAVMLARGRERFNIYCAPCHGEDGYGRGIVVRRGFPAPPNYHDERLRDAPDGHFFDVMTRGYGVMLPYSDRLGPQDRWAIVGYIRALQRSQHARIADVPEAKRSAFTP